MDARRHHRWLRMPARFPTCGKRLRLVPIWPSTRLRHGADRRERSAAEAVGKPSASSAFAPHDFLKSGRRRGAIEGSHRYGKFRDLRALGAVRAMGRRSRAQPREDATRKADRREAGNLRRRRTEVDELRAAVRDFEWVKTPQEFETAPERSAAAPNGSAAADAYTAAKGGAKPPVAPAKAPPAADPVAGEDWG